MLRTAMKPRFVRLFIVMVVLVVAFVWLGRWQWGVAHSKANDDTLKAASQQQRVPLQKLIAPQTQFDNATSLRPISVTGHFDAAKTELVAGRVLDKRPGWWVMTPLVVDGTGARLPIVRGFVATTSRVPTPPSGRVEIEGALAPGESVSTMGSLPVGQIGTIDMGSLLNEWGGTVYNAFVFETKQTPPTANSAGVQPIPPPVPEKSSIELRNAAYALQWWIFAGFAVFMWVKLVREEVHDQAQAPASGDVPDAGAGGPGPSMSPRASGPAGAQAATDTMQDEAVDTSRDAVDTREPRKDRS